MTRARASRRAGRVAELALLVLSVLVCLASAELLLRWLEWPPARGPVGWRVSAAWPGGTNSLGFRAREPAGVKRGDRILLLGDSHLEGFHLRLEDTLAPQLQQYLGRRGWPVEVVAVGAGGWGTDQEFLALRHTFDYLRPDLVLVYYTSNNDLWNNLFPTHMGAPKPTYRLVDGRLVPPDEALWLSPEAIARGGPRYGLLPALRRLLAGGYPTDLEWERTMPPRTPAPPAREGQAVLREVYREVYGPELPEWDDLESERSHFAQLKDPPTPRLLYALRLQAALVSAMKRFCDQRGVPLLFFWPQLPSSLWEGDFVQGGRSYRLSGARADARVRELFASVGVPLLEIGDLEVAHTWLPRDAHLRPAGNRFVASRVGDWLLARRAVP